MAEGSLGEPRWRLSRLAVALLGVWLAVDLGLRLMPVEQLGVSPATAAQRLAGRHSPFRSNFSVYAPDGTPGENAVLANLPSTEGQRPLRFSTDAFGYRVNPELPPGTTPDVLFVGGDSFIYGASLSDEETLPAVFTRVSGLLAYNAGRSYDSPLMLYDLDWLLAQLPTPPQTAVLVHLEQHRFDVTDRPRTTPSLWDELRFARRAVSAWWTASPLGNATRRLFRHFADGNLLPNSYLHQVTASSLPDGRPMLFRNSETYPARVPQSRGQILATADYILAWAGALQSRGMDVSVLLLPTRFTVYGPLLVEGGWRGRVIQAADNFNQLAAELNGRGISTINGLQVFQETAREDLLSGDLPFYREDNHWNLRGVERIARLLADSVCQSAAVAMRDGDKKPSRPCR